MTPLSRFGRSCLAVASSQPSGTFVNETTVSGSAQGHATIRRNPDYFQKLTVREESTSLPALRHPDRRYLVFDRITANFRETGPGTADGEKIYGTFPLKCFDREPRAVTPFTLAMLRRCRYTGWVKYAVVPGHPEFPACPLLFGLPGTGHIDLLTRQYYRSGPVAAGRASFACGRVTLVTDASGHYQPFGEPDAARQNREIAVNLFSLQGATDFRYVSMQWNADRGFRPYTLSPEKT